MADLENRLRAKGKWTFLALSILSLVALIILSFFLWYLISPRVNAMSPFLSLAIKILGILSLFVISGGLFLIVLSSALERDFLFPHGEKQITLKVLFPINLFLGKLFGLSKDQVRESFVQVNNSLFKATEKRIEKDRLLILLPHCLQNFDCPHKIVANYNNCQRCGGCLIGDIIEMTEKYNIDVSIATGGTLARKVMVEKRPSVIVAVACERDLCSGIQDAYPIPVYGVLNERPYGPCMNTKVNLENLDQAVQYILNGAKDAKRYNHQRV
ncbi:MAG: hypothetical protein AMJ91_03470 [candidate division Zixibacteria bacterium SM23_73_3]|nr:MAG: hypothetical protein AMJ91_03470 [candidate division Zixibacteria bacterium SM23_73_3]